MIPIFLLFPLRSIDVLSFIIFDRSVARATEQGEHFTLYSHRLRRAIIIVNERESAALVMPLGTISSPVFFH